MTLLHLRFAYFKVSGKFYANGGMSIESTHPVIAKCIYPMHFGRALNAAAMLPGLSGGRWSGSFTVEHDNRVDLCTPAAAQDHVASKETFDLLKRWDSVYDVLCLSAPIGSSRVDEVLKFAHEIRKLASKMIS